MFKNKETVYCVLNESLKKINSKKDPKILLSILAKLDNTLKKLSGYSFQPAKT